MSNRSSIDHPQNPFADTTETNHPSFEDSLTQLETVACDLCGSTNTRLALCVKDRIYGLPGEFNLVRCQNCGLLYINPRPDRASIGAFYPDLDYHAFRPSAGLKSRLLARRRKSEARNLLRGLPAGAAALEIGGGTGEMLVALREAGAQVTGVEPNAAAVQIVRERHGLTVYTGMLDDVDSATLPPGSFDLVLMKYALEHVHSPRATLTRIAALLKPGGRTVFWIPNAASWDARLFGAYWRGLDAPRHLYIFTPATIAGLAERAGLKVARIDYSGVPNDWTGSLGFWMADRAVTRPLARLFDVGNPIGLAALYPFSQAAAIAQRAGRMRVTLNVG